MDRVEMDRVSKQNPFKGLTQSRGPPSALTLFGHHGPIPPSREANDNIVAEERILL